MTKRRLQVIAGAMLVLGWSLAFAQEESPVHWSAKAPDKAVRAGETVEVTLQAVIDQPWHMFSITTPPGGPNPTKITLPSGTPFEIAGNIKQSKFTTVFDQNFGVNTEIFYGGADFTVTLKTAASAKAGDYAVKLEARYQVCDESSCLPPTKAAVTVTIKVH